MRLQRALRVQQQQTQALLQREYFYKFKTKLKTFAGYLKLMHDFLADTWDRHKQEVADLQIVLQCTQEKLEQQGDICREQVRPK